MKGNRGKGTTAQREADAVNSKQVGDLSKEKSEDVPERVD